MAADSLPERSLRTRYYLVLGLFVVVVSVNVVILVQNNASRESHIALETERRQYVEEVLLETQEKREQASRLLTEIETLAKIEPPESEPKAKEPEKPPQ